MPRHAISRGCVWPRSCWTKKYDEALKLVETAPVETFSPLYADLKGDILVAQGKPQEARAAYQTALDKSDGKSSYRALIQVKLDALGAAR